PLAAEAVLARQDRQPLRQPRLHLVHHEAARRRLPRRLARVARVNSHDGQVTRDQRAAGRAGEAGEVAPVLRVPMEDVVHHGGNPEAVEAFTVEKRAEPVESWCNHHACSSISRSKLVAATYPAGPSPATCPTQTAAI